MRRAAQRGENNLGCILWLLLVVVIGMVLWKAVPVKYASAQLYDYIEDQTRFRTGKQTEAQIKKRILDRADQLNLPVNPKDVSVQIKGERLRISARYTVPLEFPFYTYYWQFEHEIDRAIYYI